MKIQHISCDGCEYNKGGRCHDRTVYGPRGGDLLTDSGVRHCYQVNRTALFVDLQCKSSAKAQDRIINALWQRIRDDLALLKQEHMVLKRDTSEIVEWLQAETKDWQQTGDSNRATLAEEAEDGSVDPKEYLKHL